MLSLSVTSRGLQESPRRLQIRVTQAYGGRVKAGAPTPSRDMTPAEVWASIRHFSIEKRGPRTIPCDTLIISGEGLHLVADLSDVLARARDEAHIQRITVHLGAQDRRSFPSTTLSTVVDDVAINVRSPGDVADVAHLLNAGLRVNAVIELDDETLSAAVSLSQQLADAGASRISLTWPLTGNAPPPISDVTPIARQVARGLEGRGVTVAVKGIPPCFLNKGYFTATRTQNRWYVDADHQGDSAILFFPGMLTFAKGEDCRFCIASSRCDGVPRRWMEEGLVGKLEPISDTSGMKEKAR